MLTLHQLRRLYRDFTTKNIEAVRIAGLFTSMLNIQTSEVSQLLSFDISIMIISEGSCSSTKQDWCLYRKDGKRRSCQSQDVLGDYCRISHILGSFVPCYSLQLELGVEGCKEVNVT